MTYRPPARHEPQMGPTRPRSPSEALEPARAASRPAGTRQPREWRRVNAFVRVLSGVLTVALVSMAGLGGLALLLYHEFERSGPLEVSRTVAIPKGEGSIAIAERLERDGVIYNRWAFVLSHILQKRMGSDKARELKAGEYEFKKSASMRQVMETIADGKSLLYRLTIPEGLTSQQIVERVRADENLSGEIAAIPPEGTLLPDTHSFSKGMARQELIERMRVEQKRLLAKIWDKRRRNLPVETVSDAIVLASIVEKETGRADERERVASVFVNRLKKRMRLQSDPTIIYGIAPGQGSLGRPITRSDIDTKTVYNTYQIEGLPPTPICNPGRPAIEAVLNPAQTNDLYFVADGEGGHSFSETLKGHNAAVATWRKVEKEMRAKQELQAAATPAAATGAAAPKENVVTTIPAPPVDPAKAADGGDGPAVEEPTAQPAPAPATKAASAANVPLPIRKPKR